MKTINNKGRFSVKVKGQEVEVLFLEDYMIENEISRYKTKQKVESAEIKELVIFGRKRMKSMIVTQAPEDMEFRIGQNVSDKNGMFQLKIEDKWEEVMFVDQYADHNNYNSKQVVEYQLKQDNDIKGVRIQRQNGQFINLVICKN